MATPLLGFLWRRVLASWSPAAVALTPSARGPLRARASGPSTGRVTGACPTGPTPLLGGLAICAASCWRACCS